LRFVAVNIRVGVVNGLAAGVGPLLTFSPELNGFVIGVCLSLTFRPALGFGILVVFDGDCGAAPERGCGTVLASDRIPLPTTALRLANSGLTIWVDGLILYSLSLHSLTTLFTPSNR
jgi:hypothetical protein